MTSKQFKAARHALGLTQPELGKALGVNKRTIVRYESGVALVVPVMAELAVAYLKLQHGAKNKTIGM